ncbi:bifunctional 2-polyprenyl-6-hydroxyphenol methylase/3-demethylubiquinol 3-O-methyltransferase UbiG [Streptomyces sp. Ru87]|uniref:class I SAM-dependent methyltransferase n=1 Tax=Streptomyces sp. Ru87 TaxID=2044307 RepID=UPI000BF2F7EE|nr:class I SAM-dependent methyltransferase [Streptomyces sp. Ru87]PGH48916.1 SAM-dependent methyltransferase [Streptomyces sp. Ru87]
MPEDYWNHNTHYHPLVLDAVPGGCREALDIGCGDGLLARKLADRADRVLGVDSSAAMIRLARERTADAPGLSFLEAGFPDSPDCPASPDDRLSPGPDGPLGDGCYDFVCSVASVHHMDFTRAVGRMARLLAPGGRLVLIGVARNGTPWDLAVDAAGAVAHRVCERRHGPLREPPAIPVRDPGMTYGEVRRETRRLLPGCRYRRHLLWRWSVTWEKPRG